MFSVTGRKSYVDWTSVDPADKNYENGFRLHLQHLKVCVNPELKFETKGLDVKLEEF